MKNTVGWTDGLITGSDYLGFSVTQSYTCMRAYTHKHAQVSTKPRLLMFPTATVYKDSAAAEDRDFNMMPNIREHRG